MIKIKINQINEKIKHGGFYGSWTMLGMSFKHKKLGPFGKNANLVNMGFMQFSKNGQL